MSINPYVGFNPPLNQLHFSNGPGAGSGFRAPLSPLPQGGMNWSIPVNGSSVLPATVLIPPFSTTLEPGMLAKTAAKFPLSSPTPATEAVTPSKPGWLSLLTAATLGGIVGYIFRGWMGDDPDGEMDTGMPATPPASEQRNSSQALSGNLTEKPDDDTGFSLLKPRLTSTRTQMEPPFSRVFSQSVSPESTSLPAEAAQPDDQTQ